MPRQPKVVLLAVFTLTGFSALTLQVVWQRVISLHAGVDLFSITTVVSAFLAGIGLGSLAGGVVADRLGPRRSLLAFAASEAGVGVFAWASIWLFYDVYRAVAPSLRTTPAAFAFHFVLLVVPTTLMGLSLPLVARGVVERIEDAGPLVGRLYALNTLGAGVGAGVTGWVLLGNLGFQGTVRLAGFLNLGAAGLVLTLWRLAARVPAAGPTPDLAPPGAAAARSASIGWYLVYGLTGAVALGLEVVFFRVIDAVMRGNSYTFGHVLMLYLLLFGAGAAIASRYVGRARRPDRWFLGLQFAVGVAALVGLLVLVELPGRIGLDGPLDRLFAIDGFDPGQYDLGSFREVARFLFVHAGAPLLVMGLPVLCTGASFPFVQALVAQRLDTLGRRTGALVAANVVGNVLGTLVVGFVLLDRLGTSGTVRLLAGLLVLPGLAFAATHVGWARVTFGTGGVVALAALMGVFPSNPRLWAFLHSADASRFTLAEERSCVNALKPRQGEDLLFVNGISQNAYPFDDFHVLIGLLPTLLHPAPDSAVAVGLGIGATPYGISRDPRVGSLTVAELCGGEVALQRVLAGRGAPEPARLLGDPRVRIRIGDGRKALLAAPEESFDLATVDVVRPQSGSSGSLYSVEFYRLLASRLQDDGLFSQWSPTPRTLNSVTEVFPYVSRFTVPSYYGSQFVVASRRPIPFDREAVLGRLAGLEPDAFLPARAEALAQFLRSVEPEQIRAGGPPVPVDGRDLNRDLRPLDEFFLNNPEAVPERPRSP